MRRRLRWLGTSAAVVGLILVLWVVVTLTWQEPVSGISAAREQDRLDREFGPAPPRAVIPTAVRGARARGRLAALAHRAHGQIRIGDAFGRIKIPALDREYAVIEGADRKRLRTGPGHYEDTPFPGEPGDRGTSDDVRRAVPTHRAARAREPDRRDGQLRAIRLPRRT